MAHIDLSRAHSVTEYDGFEGIDSSKLHTGEGGIKSLSNFRLRFDGSLEKRYGFDLLLELPGKPRALHQTKEHEMLALIESTLYLLDLESRSYTQLDTLPYPSEGEASFLEYCGNIYLLDGYEVYVLFKNKLFVVDGYVPLYGSGWSCTNGGYVNEPFNMLSYHIRISFNLKSGGNSKIYLPFSVKTLDAAFLDGEPDLITRYTLNDKTVDVAVDTTYASASELMLYLTVADDVIDRSKATSCRSASVYGGGSSKNPAVFYNGNDVSSVFPSTPVDDEDIKPYSSTYPFTFDLYVSQTDKIRINDRGDPVTAVCPGNHELMIFTEKSAAILSSANYLTAISSSFGCSSQKGAIIADDIPITVSGHGVLKWKPLAYDNPEYDTVCISRRIHEIFGEDFSRSAIAHHYKSRDEIWFCDPSDENGTVVIYSTEADAWFTFSGIGAENIFEIDGEIGFSKGNAIYVFSRSADCDRRLDGEHPINGRIDSGIIMLKPCNESKKLSRCLIRTSPGATASLTLTDAKNRSVTYSLSDLSGERLGYMKKRLSVHRSRYYSFSITTDVNAVIYGVTFIAQD